MDLVDQFCWDVVSGAVLYKIYCNVDLTNLLEMVLPSDQSIYCKHFVNIVLIRVVLVRII